MVRFALVFIVVLTACSSPAVIPTRPAGPAITRPTAKMNATVTFEVPSPDPSQAREARVTLEQNGHPAHEATVGLVPGGQSCRPAPVVGLRCTLHASLVTREDVTYGITIVDGHGKVRFTRRETVAGSYASLFSFVLTKKWTSARVNFTNPTMGAPSRTPLIVSAIYDDPANQLDGIVVGPQRLEQPIGLTDGDKTGATKIASGNVTSPSDKPQLFYDGKSFINPWIGVGERRSGRQQFIPFLRVREYRVPSHDQTSTNAGNGRLFVNADGSITFLEHSAVGRIDSKGTITETPLHLYEYDIAKGPDGHVWALVSGGSGSALARLNDDGTLTQFPLPDWDFGPIAVGADGNFWMPASSPSYYNSIVRRVTTTGTVTDFPMPGNETSLRDDVAGGDGNVWFIGTGQQFAGAPGTGVFVKVQSDGTRTQYWLPGFDEPCCEPALENPVWGPDGKLYAAVGYAHLAQVAEGGKFRQFSHNLEMQIPSASPPVIPPMTIGPDGAIWYAADEDHGNCTLGRVTTSGTVAFVHFAQSCSTGYLVNSLPTAFVAGPNKTLWYTRDDRVGKISL